MPVPKIWAAYDRLDAADLNGDFAYLDGRMGGGVSLVGALCPAGATVTPAGGTEAEVFGGAPAAGDDPAGLWVAATKRIVIPAGLGGLWMVTATGTFAGGTAGDLRAIRVAGMTPPPGTSVPFPGRGASASGWYITWLGRVADLAAIQLFGVAFTTGSTFGITGLVVARLAPLAFRAP